MKAFVQVITTSPKGDHKVLRFKKPVQATGKQNHDLALIKQMATVAINAAYAEFTIRVADYSVCLVLADASVIEFSNGRTACITQRGLSVSKVNPAFLLFYDAKAARKTNPYWVMQYANFPNPVE